MKYQGMELNSDNYIPSPIFQPIEKEPRISQPTLENLGNEVQILKSDIGVFNEAIVIKKRGWDQLKLECLSVLNELNICDKWEPVQMEWTIPQRANSETVRLGIEFLQQHEPGLITI
jgi:hypothetical protein